MERKIRFTRRELVWEEYQMIYDEEQWNKLMDWLSKLSDPQSTKRYATLKDIPFEEICSMVNGEKPDISWDFPFIGWDGKEHTCLESLTDFVTDMMREDAWDAGPWDSFSGDDSEEELVVESSNYEA